MRDRQRRNLRAADRQFDEEGGAGRVLRLQSNASTMLLDDGVGNGQSQTGALAYFLRREERIEDFRLQVVGDSRAVVVDLELDRLVPGVVPGADDDGSAAVVREHGLLGVDDQVEQHLLDLMAVGEDLRKSGR